MKKILLLVYFTIPTMLFAQKKQGQQLVDSLLKVLPTLQSDTIKVKVLYDISSGYRAFNASEGIKYAQQALELSSDLDWQKGKAMSYGAIGSNYTGKSDYPKALENLFKALSINESINNTKGQAVNLLNIGVVYMKKGDQQTALSYYYKSKTLYEQLRDNNGISFNLNNISIIYQEQKNYTKALECYKLALNIASNENNKTQISTTLGNIGVVYFFQKEYDKALAAHFAALKISEELGNKGLSADNMGNIGVSYRNIAGESTLYVKGDSLIPKGKQANLQLSVEYFTRAIKQGREIGYLDAIQEFYSGLSETYMLMGEKDKALESYKEYVAIKDSTGSADIRLKIANLEATRAMELKDKELEIEKLKVANTRKERVLYISGLLLLLATVAIVFRKFYFQRRSNRVLSIEKRKYLQHIKVQEDVLKNITHVQSHDLRGPVSTILGLAKLYDQEHPDDPDNNTIINDIIDVSVKLDKQITSLIKKENKLAADSKDMNNDSHTNF
ncbi:hypothetical protein CJD36_005165 [Flavipsychrobacter stenotrophus]|uniref:histidine kinase n=1 Tax=Flavipsychrobacter stenotrophus TaxID=2077091 RepID=A0A2S7SX60_9BACT|nr:tetratricopeptide repeat protein [Flavipsychrobacter stenotrophus]PQJ11197.1 hypothetical protein CJD36_005165 [Flavipsychrobacter stenotrophus]